VSNRLFVPLSAEPYQWFSSGQKHWELRRYGRQYTERHVWPHRTVELRHGYSDPNRSLWGTIVAVQRAENLKDFFDQVPYTQVIPSANSLKEAIITAKKILGLSSEQSGPVLGFEVSFHDHHPSIR
jgi:ASC-1-like (ASCH) protein